MDITSKEVKMTNIFEQLLGNISRIPRTTAQKFSWYFSQLRMQTFTMNGQFSRARSNIFRYQPIILLIVVKSYVSNQWVEELMICILIRIYHQDFEQSSLRFFYTRNRGPGREGLIRAGTAWGSRGKPCGRRRIQKFFKKQWKIMKFVQKFSNIFSNFSRKFCQTNLEILRNHLFVGVSGCRLPHQPKSRHLIKILV